MRESERRQDDITSMGSMSFFATEGWMKTKNFLGGTASGMANTIAGHPFDTIKVRMQTEGVHGRFKGVVDCFTTTLKEEGVRGLYKGVTPPFFGMGIINSCLFGTMHLVQDLMIKSSSSSKELSSSSSLSDSLSIPQVMFAGLITGGAVSVVVTPIEQIKARLQVQYSVKNAPQLYSGPIDCLSKLIKNNGMFHGPFKGFTATIMTRASVASYFGGYELSTRWMRSKKQGINKTDSGTTTLNSLEKFLCGGLAGTCYWLTAFPFDVVKNRISSQPDVVPLKYPSTRSCFRHIYQKEGIAGFWRGFVPCALRTFPANGATFVAFALVMECLP
eukprot:gb/GECH01003341.1/.p1 GENE.gb/GECH01003341.1/~~gb/GECH01003341.1/.p1  ORF type:complete len:331 (+),score=89.64 gb/GECH01003341.1/:1-993(+)